MPKGKLTPKQSNFIKEYLVDMNATQAAIRAGYSARNADKIGPELLGKTRIQQALNSERVKIEKRTDITIDRCLKEYARIAFLDISQVFADDGTLKSIKDIPEDARRAIAGLEVTDLTEMGAKYGMLSKIKLVDKKGALDSIMKHLGGFVEKHEHSGPGGRPIQVENKFKDWTDEELELYATTGIKPDRFR